MCTDFNQPLRFNTSEVTNMEVMFKSCKTFNQPLEWNTSNVTDMMEMFMDCTAFNQKIESWDTSKADTENWLLGTRIEEIRMNGAGQMLL